MNAPIVKTRTDSFRRFLQGDPQERPYVVLDPSSYAAEYAGKPGGQPTLEDNLAFHTAFANDGFIGEFVMPDRYLPELAWKRTIVKQQGEETFFEETLKIPFGLKRRIIAEKKGTIPWLVEPPVKTVADFTLIDYYADCVAANTAAVARDLAPRFATCRANGFMVSSVLLTAFEVYYLIDYPDQPLFYYDHTERYLASIKKVHRANLALAEELVKAGCDLFNMGSAGLELLSPTIFDEAIIPFARETTDHLRALDAFSSYHICGHSRQLLESGRVNAIKPTWFETFSTAPCGNHRSLRESLAWLDPGIISKGNLPLELLRNGTPDQIRRAVDDILAQSQDRRHIVAQADATILSGTPKTNIEAFLAAVRDGPGGGTRQRE